MTGASAPCKIETVMVSLGIRKAGFLCMYLCLILVHYCGVRQYVFLSLYCQGECAHCTSSSSCAHHVIYEIFGRLVPNLTPF